MVEREAMTCSARRSARGHMVSPLAGVGGTAHAGPGGVGAEFTRSEVADSRLFIAMSCALLEADWACCAILSRSDARRSYSAAMEASLRACSAGGVGAWLGGSSNLAFRFLRIWAMLALIWACSSALSSFRDLELRRACR